AAGREWRRKRSSGSSGASGGPAEGRAQALAGLRTPTRLPELSENSSFFQTGPSAPDSAQTVTVLVAHDAVSIHPAKQFRLPSWPTVPTACPATAPVGMKPTAVWMAL